MRYRTIHTLVCFLLLMAANIQAELDTTRSLSSLPGQYSAGHG